MTTPIDAAALAKIPKPSVQYVKPRLTAGRLAYLIFHCPKRFLREKPLQTLRNQWKKYQMRATIDTFDFHCKPTETETLHAHFLLGKRYLYEAALTVYSFSKATGHPIQAHLYDDGTLQQCHIEFLKNKIPDCHIVSIDSIENQLEQRLPESSYPILRSLRYAYPHIRKLTDIHSFDDSWKLVMDTDILFFRKPVQLIGAIRQNQWLHMVDCMPNYGIDASLLEGLTAHPVHPKVNVGICHLDSRLLDWEQIEFWCARLLAEHGFSYYLEQAITAAILSLHTATPLDEQYIVYPDLHTARQAEVAAMHYVDKSRTFFYDFAWKQVLK